MDYAQLHPSILFARVGRRLDFDLYTLPGLESSALREVGKDTFMRLLNRTSGDGERSQVRMWAKDRKLLPKGVTPNEYMRRFLVQMGPIGRWLSTGEGTRLQREDSDLAVNILSKMSDLGVAVLPVHDSFIVGEGHGEALRGVMTEAYKEQYGFIPIIR